MKPKLASIEATVNSSPSADRRDVDVGARLRELRTSRRLKLRDVADAAGISESFLSQVERQKANISLTTLKSVANVFGLTIAEFFDDSHELPYLLREEERPSLEFAGMGTKFLLTPRPLANLEVFVAHIPPGGATAEEAYVHGHSEEIVLVLRGELTAYVGDEEHVVREGDSLHFMSSTPHRSVNAGTEVVHALWIISPPSL